MKRSLILLLVVVVLAGYLGTMIARDPGYVLITYGDYSFQSSLWVLLGLVAGFTLVFYVLLRVYRLVRRTGLVYRDWREHRRSARSDKLIQKGMMLLAEGEFERALRFLKSDVDTQPERGVTYLAAARAADGLGDHEARETFLRLAEEADPRLSRARAVVAAELAMNRSDMDTALTILSGLKSNKYIASLKREALGGKENWRDMMASLPELRRTDKSAADSLERSAVMLAVDLEHHHDQTLHELYRSLSASLKKDSDILAGYAAALKDKSAVEPLIRSAIRKNWQPVLVELYGEADDNLKRRRRTAESWSKTHKNDPSLQYCLGCIFEASGETKLAKDAFAASVELGGPRKANERLALVLAQSGEFERSNQQLRLAMREPIDSAAPNERP
ncbi:MAG: HemY protein [Candidatus Azotimanducaceae bacterium]|jgi:HemY protein